MAKTRLGTLDSLRGIAALVVVFHHCASITIASAGGTKFGRIFEVYLINAGHPAVILFFVLSGFVLALQFFKRQTPPYFSFVIKRVFRIYPALLASVVISAILFAAIGNQISGVPWAEQAWLSPPSIDHLLRYIYLPAASPADIDLNGATWSLAYEIRISLLMPLIAWAVSQFRWTFPLALLAMGSIGAALNSEGLDYPLILGGSVSGSLLISAYYAGCFFIGAQGAKWHLQGFLPGIWRPLELSVVGIAIFTLLRVHNDVVASLMSLMLIAMALRGSISQVVLGFWPLRWLGRVSYSLYLIHCPIIYALLAFRGRVSDLTVCAAAIVLSLLCAEILYRCCEMPGIALGARLAKVRAYGGLTTP